jgi:hypothetical protein
LNFFSVQFLINYLYSKVQTNNKKSALKGYTIAKEGAVMCMPSYLSKATFTF